MIIKKATKKGFSEIKPLMVLKEVSVIKTENVISWSDFSEGSKKGQI